MFRRRPLGTPWSPGCRPQQPSLSIVRSMCQPSDLLLRAVAAVFVDAALDVFRYRLGAFIPKLNTVRSAVIRLAKHTQQRAGTVLSHLFRLTFWLVVLVFAHGSLVGGLAIGEFAGAHVVGQATTTPVVHCLPFASMGLGGGHALGSRRVASSGSPEQVGC